MTTRKGSTRAWRKLRQAVLERDNYRCYLCGESDADSVDHITPVANGGSDNPNNLAAAHLGCNVRKGIGHTYSGGGPTKSASRRRSISPVKGGTSITPDPPGADRPGLAAKKTPAVRQAPPKLA